MPEFLKQNATAILALLGVVVGSLLTGGFALWKDWILRNRDFDLKVWERFLDRRMTAHEAVLDVAIKMRVMVSSGKVETPGEISRAPQLMMSKEAFHDWLFDFAEKSGTATTWLSTPVKMELNFVQDYFVTLNTHLSEAPSERFAAEGSFIRQDFIDLSSALEIKAFEYFKAEARELRLNNLTEHHKYPLAETKRRLQKTVLLARLAEIKSIIGSTS